jgi:hypothetical protein
MNFFGINPYGTLGLAPYGLRWTDEMLGQPAFEAKGQGYFGNIPTPDGQSMTEMSTSFDVNGQTVSAPLVVPTLTNEEILALTQGQDIPEPVFQKAFEYALQRISEGKSPFAQMDELRFGGLLGGRM